MYLILVWNTGKAEGITHCIVDSSEAVQTTIAYGFQGSVNLITTLVVVPTSASTHKGVLGKNVVRRERPVGHRFEVAS